MPDLSKKIPADLLGPSLLEGVYFPNLVASPLMVNKDYAELLYNRTSSPHLSKVLQKWDEGRWDLTHGKSTLQNEIMGGLQAEFSSAPDKGEELGATLGSGHSGNSAGPFAHSLAHLFLCHDPSLPLSVPSFPVHYFLKVSGISKRVPALNVDLFTSVTPGAAFDLPAVVMT